MQEWWKDCIERGLAGFEGLNKEEKKYLLDGIIKSNSGTQKLGGMLRHKDRKVQGQDTEEKEEERRNGGWRLERKRREHNV